MYEEVRTMPSQKDCFLQMLQRNTIEISGYRDQKDSKKRLGVSIEQQA